MPRTVFPPVSCRSISVPEFKGDKSKVMCNLSGQRVSCDRAAVCAGYVRNPRRAVFVDCNCCLYTDPSTREVDDDE